MAAEVSDSTEIYPQVSKQMDSLAPEPPVSLGLKAEDGSSSDLSDLDEDVIIGDIEPDHYYEGGQVPVFKPVSKQLHDLEEA